MAASGLRRDVPFSAFYAWASAAAGEEVPLAGIASRVGRTYSALAEARKLDVIEGRLVVQYAREVGRSPLEALAESLDMADLRTSPQPSRTETLSQVPYGLLLEEVAARMGGAPSRSPVPVGGTSASRWVDALCEMSGGTITALAPAVGMEYRGFQSKRARDRFMPTELHAVCRETGGTLQVGLVAQGWLTWDETKLPPRGREEAMQEWPSADMFAWLERSAAEMRRAEAKK